MFRNLGTAELLIIGVIIIVFFGNKKLNELARGLGESSKEFRQVKKEIDQLKKDTPLDK